MDMVEGKSSILIFEKGRLAQEIGWGGGGGGREGRKDGTSKPPLSL